MSTWPGGSSCSAGRRVFAPGARLYHHLSATGGGTLASYYTGRNTMWVIAKDMPGPLIRRHFGRILGAQWTRHAGRAARVARRGGARHGCAGNWRALLGLPRALRLAARRSQSTADRRLLKQLIVCYFAD